MGAVRSAKLVARPPVAEPSWGDVVVATGVVVSVVGLLEALRRHTDQAIRTAEHVLSAGNEFAQQTQASHLLRSCARGSRVLVAELERELGVSPEGGGS